MAVATIDFTSKELKMNTLVTVCFPDSVRTNGVPLSKRKVLWLLHGLSDDGTSWLRYSRIDKYAMENDLVVVMPSVNRSMYCDNVNGQNYFSFIADELPDYFEKVFHLSRKREDNFIAGLSMGGMGAAKIALTYPERYEAMGSFSGVLNLEPLKLVLNDEMKNDFPFMLSALENTKESPLNPTALLDKEKHKNLKMYIACGLQDKLIVASLMFKKQADKLGLKAKYSFTKGNHEWDFWDKQLKRFIDFILG
ncbi:MAG: alpha/beta hydrolase [Acutalibacteraceae bacterium]